jgi:hypothetical protein
MASADRRRRRHKQEGQRSPLLLAVVPAHLSTRALRVLLQLRASEQPCSCVETLAVTGAAAGKSYSANSSTFPSSISTVFAAAWPQPCKVPVYNCALAGFTSLFNEKDRVGVVASASPRGVVSRLAGTRTRECLESTLSFPVRESPSRVYSAILRKRLFKLTSVTFWARPRKAWVFIRLGVT